MYAVMLLELLRSAEKMHAVAYRKFPGRLVVKSVAFGSKWQKASGNRGHS